MGQEGRWEVNPRPKSRNEPSAKGERSESEIQRRSESRSWEIKQRAKLRSKPEGIAKQSGCPAAWTLSTLG